MATTASWGFGTRPRERIWAPKGHSGDIPDIAFSPDGESLASAALADRSVKLWAVPTGKERATLRGHGGWLRRVSFSPDGKTLASCADDRTIRLWDTASGTESAAWDKSPPM